MSLLKIEEFQLEMVNGGYLFLYEMGDEKIQKNPSYEDFISLKYVKKFDYLFLRTNMKRL